MELATNSPTRQDPTAVLDSSAETVSEIEQRLNDLTAKREIGGIAQWSVSSCKQGFGVDQLRDNSTETYWQSDGALPHFINIQFQRSLKITHVFFHVNLAQDESYTPHQIRLRVGSQFNDLHEIASITLDQPAGWHEINLKQLHEDEDIYAHYVQLCIESNHQSGKDCHIRQVKIFSDRPMFLPEDDFHMQSMEFEHYTIIR